VQESEKFDKRSKTAPVKTNCIKFSTYLASKLGTSFSCSLTGFVDGIDMARLSEEDKVRVLRAVNRQCWCPLVTAPIMEKTIDPRTWFGGLYDCLFKKARDIESQE